MLQRGISIAQGAYQIGRVAAPYIAAMLWSLLCVIGNAVPMTYIYKKEMDFDNVFVANPAPAMNIARRGEVDQAAIDAVSEEPNFPSLQKLRRVLDQRGIA